ncbi:hypothetical protein HF313_05390 [Massilia atriviolacea]|uniref:Uncharacterized protein n=1 Tax=Massilia atriviolacea TaxID=2495579 RepID=A0A430HHB8_9BURK|nr:hypothetical protein [Massilia atriviolacea]RSZ56918.1 hypothetical protein EJB06_21535 [Massilia atriviolacea]
MFAAFCPPTPQDERRCFHAAQQPPRNRQAIGTQSARNMLAFFDARAAQGVIDLFTQAGQGAPGR